MAHTRGPWVIDKADNFTIIYKHGPTGENICEVVGNMANADLIAASPELLDACKNALDIINAYSHIPAQFKACEILQAAILKAEGRE